MRASSQLNLCESHPVVLAVFKLSDNAKVCVSLSPAQCIVLCGDVSRTEMQATRPTRVVAIVQPPPARVMTRYPSAIGKGVEIAKSSAPSERRFRRGFPFKEDLRET